MLGFLFIRRCHVQYLERFGEAYVRGDSETREQLKDILIAIQTTVLSSLRRALTDDVRLDYPAVRSELQKNEDNAVDCLWRLSRNLSVRAAARTESSLQAGHSMPDPRRWKLAPDILTYSKDWAENYSKSLGELLQICSAQDSPELDENTTSTVSIMRTVIEEPVQGRLSDIDMDRFSAISLTPSSLSGFASLRSLARRIRRGEPCTETDSIDGLPSGVMMWNRSGSSLQLFSRLSNRLSVASSRKTGSSHMSWRPEIPATIQEDDGARLMESAHGSEDPKALRYLVRNSPFT